MDMDSEDIQEAEQDITSTARKEHECKEEVKEKCLKSKHDGMEDQSGCKEEKLVDSAAKATNVDEVKEGHELNDVVETIKEESIEDDIEDTKKIKRRGLLKRLRSFFVRTRRRFRPNGGAYEFEVIDDKTEGVSVDESSVSTVVAVKEDADKGRTVVTTHEDVTTEDTEKKEHTETSTTTAKKMTKKEKKIHDKEKKTMISEKKMTKNSIMHTHNEGDTLSEEQNGA